MTDEVLADEGGGVSTQRETILQALRDAGDRGVCVTDLGQIDWTCVLTARNRIAEARADGVPIRSEVCKVHRHRSSVARYFWAPVGQLEMGAL